MVHRTEVNYLTYNPTNALQLQQRAAAAPLTNYARTRRKQQNTLADPHGTDHPTKKCNRTLSRVPDVPWQLLTSQAIIDQGDSTDSQPFKY